VSTPSTSGQAAQKATDEELALAERRGADRVRAQVRDVLADRRRVVRLGVDRIEVVEVSAIAEVIAEVIAVDAE
jgi:hypothetical protein